MTGTPDHYEVLGVDPTADREAIRRAYLAVARTTHPDRASGDAAARATAARTIRLANAAWTVLGDEGRRREYDRRRAGAPASVPMSAPTAPRTRIVDAHVRVAGGPTGGSTSPLAWAAVVALLLGVVVVLVVSAYATAGDRSTVSTTTTVVAPTVGSCVDVRPSDAGPVATVLPCGTATSGRVVAIVESPRPCPTGTAIALADARTTLCLTPV